MSHQARTVEGVTRYYETKERAKERAIKYYDHILKCNGTHDAIGDLTKLLTSFALDERKREKSDLPVQPPTKAEQESDAQTHLVGGCSQCSSEAKPGTLGHAQDSDRECFHKARAKGEPTFTLRAQDVSAPALVREWVRRNGATCPVEKLADALRIAQAMERWPSKKAAD